jgi:uncharacterized membrane protein
MSELIISAFQNENGAYEMDDNIHQLKRRN